MSRLSVRVLRYNPETDEVPYWKDYTVEVDPTDRVLAVAPFFHAVGLIVLAGRALARGATLVTLPRFDVLATLARYPDGVSMGELSRALLVSNGNVTALVRQLETDELISSRPASDDRRSFIVALTPQGRRHFAELAAAHRSWIEGMFAGMPQDDQMALYELLATLKRSIAADEEGA